MFSENGCTAVICTIIQRICTGKKGCENYQENLVEGDIFFD